MTEIVEGLRKGSEPATGTKWTDGPQTKTPAIKDSSFAAQRPWAGWVWGFGRRVFWLLVLLLALSPAPRVAGAAEGKPTNYALLVGISVYDYETVLEGVIPLEFADADAESLAKSLGEDYEIRTLVNQQASRRALMSELIRLRMEAKKEDSLLILLSGHGLLDPTNGEVYWLTYDSKLEVLDDRAIRLKHFLEYVQEIDADRKLVLLDHCFSGRLDRLPDSSEDGGSKAGGTRRRRVRIAKGLVPESLKDAIKQSAHGLVVLAASSDIAWEHKKIEHGVLTKAVLNAFDTRRADTTGDGKLQLSELLLFLKDEVSKLARELKPEAEKNLKAQELVEYSKEGVDLSTWVLKELPADLEEVEAERGKLIETLKAWRVEGFIKAGTLLSCEGALDRWLESLSEDKPPDDTDLRIIKEIRTHVRLMGNGKFKPEQVGRALDDLMESLGNEP